MTGAHAGHFVFIPRTALTTTKDYHLPFTLTRRRFPTKPSYAMTINKSKELEFIFHNHFNSMSRVKSYDGLRFALVPPSENFLTLTSYTNNVVFKSA